MLTPSLCLDMSLGGEVVGRSKGESHSKIGFGGDLYPSIPTFSIANCGKRPREV